MKFLSFKSLLCSASFIVPMVSVCLLISSISPAEAQNNKESWFPFSPAKEVSPSVIDMSSWLDAPAGKHGFVQMKGNDFVFEDGTPVKFWGVNICSGRPYISKDEAKKWTAFLAKYGINGVRFHKFTSRALKGNVSTVLDSAMVDNMDFFHGELRNRGIYYGWSHIYGHKPKPGDKEKMLAYEEVANIKLPWSHLNASTASLVNFAEDLQNLNIELTVNMLNHRNPYTGLTYANDPALSFVELQNEDNIFWGAIEATLDQVPTYRALLCKQFSEWLTKKYRTQEALGKAWGLGALMPGESLSKGNIYPKPNHGWFQAEFEKSAKENRPIKQHYLDKAQFLYETQVNFYNRFVKAIRQTGYKGPIVGSCWQAGIGITHLYNLHADYQIGFIDRHNYFGGGTGHHLVPGKIDNEAMVSKPGSGLLSTGMQLVSDRPFALSEWMSLIPNEWTAESSPIIAAYGMGLQGWDASYSFAVDYPHFTSTIHTPGVYNVTAPTQLTLYPALARMIYAGDVKEGEVAAIRNVHIPSLAEGKVGFVENVKQDYDVKSFEGEVPVEALAVGPVEIAFTDKFEQTTKPDLSPYSDTLQKIVNSNTGQLSWNYKEKGFFTINTPGTKAAVGFTEGKKLDLDGVNLQIQTPFAVVMVTSLEKNVPIAKAKRILVTTVARAENTGMKYNADKSQLLEVGQAPILLEPVKASLTLGRPGVPKVIVLDHVGRRTNKVIKPKGEEIVLDGNLYKTIYYELQYK